MNDWEYFFERLQIKDPSLSMDMERKEKLLLCFQKMDGIYDLTFNARGGTLIFKYDPSRLDKEDILLQLEDCGYKDLAHAASICPKIHPLKKLQQVFLRNPLHLLL